MAEIIKDRVKESSTTTGTGPFTLTGAGTGFRTFGSVCSVGDTFRCTIVADDGDWQVGIGRYSAENEITMDSVVDSNSGSPVTFAAGAKTLFIGMDAAAASWIRERLTAARTYYVRTDGSDSNSGLVDSAGGAFLTIQKAVDVVVNNIDVAGFAVTIQLGDGTYTAGAALGKITGDGSATITGNAGTPGNVIVSVTGANAFASSRRAEWTITNLRVQTTTSGICIVARTGASLLFSGIVFGSSASSHIQAESGGEVTATGSYSIVGGAANQHANALYGGKFFCRSRTVTLTGTPNFGNDYVRSYYASVIMIDGCTFSGSATGGRQAVRFNGVIDTGVFGTTPTYLPGNAAGGGAATGGVIN
jgi:hypothetical protein